VTRNDAGAGAFNVDPDPAVRLANWRNLCRRHISEEVCDRLARHGFADLALELLHQRGDLP
jgi:hypothetical protein